MGDSVIASRLLKGNTDVCVTSSGIQYWAQGRMTYEIQLPLTSVLYLQPGGLSGYLGERKAEHTNAYKYTCTQTHIYTHTQRRPCTLCLMVSMESCQIHWRSFSSSYTLHPSHFLVSFPLPSASLFPPPPPLSLFFSNSVMLLTPTSTSQLYHYLPYERNRPTQRKVRHGMSVK